MSITTVQTETATLLAPQQLRLRMRASSDALIGILEVYAGWRDPLSERIRNWAFAAFEGVESAPEAILMEQLRDRFRALDQNILVSSLDRKSLSEVPYLIDGENVLPESVFDNLCHTASQAKMGSPFNQRPMEFRQKVHQFALAILRWRGVRCEETPPTQAVPLQDRLSALLNYLPIQSQAQLSLELQRGEDAEKMHLRNAARIRKQTNQIRAEHENAVAEMLTGLEEQQRALNGRLDGMTRTYETRIRELQGRIDAADQQISTLQGRVGDAEQVNEQHREALVSLKNRIRAAEAELARIRAEMDGGDEWCVIS